MHMTCRVMPLLASLFLLAACDGNSGAENVTNEMGELARETADETGDVVEATADAVEESCEEVLDAADAARRDC